MTDPGMPPYPVMEHMAEAIVGYLYRGDQSCGISIDAEGSIFTSSKGYGVEWFPEDVGTLADLYGPIPRAQRRVVMRSLARARKRVRKQGEG